MFTFPDWTVFSFVILTIVGFALGAVFWLKSRIQGSRTVAWQRIAESLGFSYKERETLAPCSRILTLTRSRKVLNSPGICWSPKQMAFGGASPTTSLSAKMAQTSPKPSAWFGPIGSRFRASALQHSAGNLAFSKDDKADVKDCRSPIHRAS